MTDKSFINWMDDARGNSWVMPFAPWWKRLPLVRHVRTIYHAIRVRRHDQFWSQTGLLRTGYDQWVLYGMWHGYERGEEDQ